MSLDFDLVVPSRDGFPHVFVIAQEYRRLGLTPRYFIDDRSSRPCLALTRALLANVTMIAAAGESIEEILPQIAAQTKARWIVRIDDDEAPSAALVTWLKQMVAAPGKTVIAIPRRAARFQEGTLIYARVIPKLGRHDYQYRGFITDGMTFSPTLHTAGIEFAESDIIVAPDECCIYHFDWIVRTRAERDNKLARYETMRSGCRDLFAFQYLPEDFAPEHYDYALLEDRHMARLAKRLRLAKRTHGFAIRIANLTPKRWRTSAAHSMA